MQKTKSEIEYYERVKQYVDLRGIKTRNDLEIRLQKAGMLGKVRTYKQMNIVARELDLTMRGKPEEFNSYTKQTLYKGKKSKVIYRDKKTGKFIKKQT
jgi:hypothetical protein